MVRSCRPGKHVVAKGQGRQDCWKKGTTSTQLVSGKHQLHALPSLSFKQAAARDRAPALAYTNVFGEGGSNGTALYYLASAFDGVYMPPTGCVSFLGVEATQVLLDNTCAYVPSNSTTLEQPHT